MVSKKMKTYSVDEYGVKNYSTLYLAFITLIILYLIIGAFSVALLHFEQSASNANIVTYGDAFWTLMMSASTIGFGDHYPVTAPGRIIIAAMFYIGVGMVGFIGGQFVNKFVGFSDTNVKNRELRRQNAEILEHNKKLEKKIDHLLKEVHLLLEKQNEQTKKG